MTQTFEMQLLEGEEAEDMVRHLLLMDAADAANARCREGLVEGQMGMLSMHTESENGTWVAGIMWMCSKDKSHHWMVFRADRLAPETIRLAKTMINLTMEKIFDTAPGEREIVTVERSLHHAARVTKL